MLFMPWVRSSKSPRHTNRAVATNPRWLTRAARIRFRRAKLMAMPANTATPNQMAIVLREIRGIRAQLDKLLLLVPQESLKEYENSAKIRRAYARAIKTAVPGRS